MSKDEKQQILNAAAFLADARMELDELRDTKQEAFDELEEAVQESEKGEKLQSVIDEIEGAISTIEDLEDELQGLI